MHLQYKHSYQGAGPLEGGHLWGLILNSYLWVCIVFPFRDPTGICCHLTRCHARAYVLHEDWFSWILLKNRMHLSRRQYKLTVSWILLIYNLRISSLMFLLPPTYWPSEVGANCPGEGPEKIPVLWAENHCLPRWLHVLVYTEQSPFVSVIPD